MNPQDPLAALHPLREPGLIGWWPPAPGWLLLGALLLAGLLILAFLGLRRYRANAYRRRALARLETLYSSYRGNGDGSTYLAGVNALLKRVALTAYPRRDIAGRSGEQWLAFLNGQLTGDARFDPAFATAVYRESPADIDLDHIHRSARRWIRQHEARR